MIFCEFQMYKAHEVKYAGTHGYEVSTILCVSVFNVPTDWMAGRRQGRKSNTASQMLFQFLDMKAMPLQEEKKSVSTVVQWSCLSP